MIILQKWITYFFIYSIIGWIIESIYVSIIFKKVVNSGFLIGPIIPVYGCGAITLLIIEQYIAVYIPIGIRLLLYTIIANVIEYYTGALLEEMFHIKLWDYSNKFLNIKGRICLLQSIYWAGLSWIVLVIIHPFI